MKYTLQPSPDNTWNLLVEGFASPEEANKAAVMYQATSEMLEALKEADRLYADDAKRTKVIRAAIAKAEGRE